MIYTQTQINREDNSASTAWDKFLPQYSKALQRPLVLNHTGELKYLVRNSIPMDYLFFWGHVQRGNEISSACLSQWYPASFTMYGKEFKTAEHWMMYNKALLFKDHQKAQEILDAETPREAKSLGREVQNFDFHKWTAAADKILILGNIEKFTQNPSLGNFLKGTLSRVLVEASPYDKIYGIGMKTTDPKVTDPYSWRGKNKLGFVLMQVRKILREGNCIDQKITLP